MGWDETTAGRKNSKSGPKKIKNKAPTSPNKSTGPNIRHVGLQVVSKENPTTEGWVSTHPASTNQGGMEFTYLESDPKRKRDYLKTDFSHGKETKIRQGNQKLEHSYGNTHAIGGGC